MPKVRVEDARRFMVEALTVVGAPHSEAYKQASLLMHADCVGHYSHGMNRLEYYIKDIQTRACIPAAKPVILKESAGTAWVDGEDALGATVGFFCMDLAIKKAREAGIGIVTVKRSNHFGMAGFWALQAEKEGLIGMAFTNSSPILVPTRAKDGALGTNPISMAAPASNGDSFVLDMATTTVALGKIEVQRRKGEPIPEGWALDKHGNVTTDAQAAIDGERLLPLGGTEKTSGYKGYGLSAMVEVLCSGLSGSDSTHNVRLWDVNSEGSPPNLGQCFIAIDPGCFAPGFAERVADCLQHWRSMEPEDPSLPVLAPGDKERAHRAKTSETETIDYLPAQIEACHELAHKLKLWPLTIL